MPYPTSFEFSARLFGVFALLCLALVALAGLRRKR
jgi:hypothetical protein